MALVGRFEYKGLVADMAYARIEEVTGGKMFGWRGHVRIYAEADTAARSLTEPPEEPDITGANPMQSVYHNPGQMSLHQFMVHAAYEQGVAPLPSLYRSLKELPEFANWTEA